MNTTPQPTPRAAGEAVKAFREYLAVHPDACTGMGGHAMDDMALDLARISLHFQATAPAHLHQICEPAAPAPHQVLPPSAQDFEEQAALAALTPHAEELQALAKASKQILALVQLPAPAPTDAELLALNDGELFFSESPSKYPEAGFGTQYHGGAPGVLAFARAVIALAGPPRQPQEDALLQVQQAIHDYHFELDCRKHGILAADKALKAIEAALGTHWVQGKELAARAAPGAAP
ncbi:hypothetical protein [Comamonas sp.]|uniref:hypothetical protein n=1 Tax=Comamonas sp. TaxID=34028 RepID=UPI002FCA922E